MLSWSGVAGDGVPLVALVVLLVLAFRPVKGWVEAAAGVVAALACIAVPTSSWGQATTAAEQILPVVVFLVAILVVAGVCADLGLFRAIGARIGRPGTRPRRFLLLTFVAAVAVTAVLSLDATVVLLTLVVLAAAGSAGLRAQPALSACVRLANSSSLLLPVSNLTTLLAMRHLPLSFTTYALVMAPAWVVVVLVEYAAHRLLWRRDLAAEPEVVTVPEGGPPPLPAYPLVVVVAMLIGFAVVSALGVGAAWGAAWVALVAAGLLLAPSLARRTSTLGEVAHAAHAGFAVYVLGLAVVVDALARGGLGDLVARLLPRYLAPGEPHFTDFHSLGLVEVVWVALLATVLANLVNNLPATLLLVPLVAPLGAEAVLAALVGLNVGASLTWTGSLANLLWRRTLTHAGAPPSSRDFHRVSLVVVPVAVVVGAAVVWLTVGVLDSSIPELIAMSR